MLGLATFQFPNGFSQTIITLKATSVIGLNFQFPNGFSQNFCTKF